MRLIGVNRSLTEEYIHPGKKNLLKFCKHYSFIKTTTKSPLGGSHDKYKFFSFSNQTNNIFAIIFAEHFCQYEYIFLFYISNLKENWRIFLFTAGLGGLIVWRLYLGGRRICLQTFLFFYICYNAIQSRNFERFKQR